MYPRLFILSLLIVAAPGLAQEEPAPPGPWTGAAEISYVATSGNTSTTTLGLGGLLEYVRPNWSAELKGSFVRSENEGEENARALTALVGAERVLRPKLSGYVRSEYLQNRFAGIERRLTSEAGLGWDLLEGEPHTLRFEAGVGHTDEDRTTVEDLAFASGRTGLTWKWAITETASLEEEASVLVNLEDAGDYRFLNVASISAAINSRLSLKLSHTLNYVDDPVPGFETTDTMTSAAIVAKF